MKRSVNTATTLIDGFFSSKDKDLTMAIQKIKALQPSTETELSKTNANHSIIIETLLKQLLAGNKVRVIDHPEKDRAEVIGAIAKLRDDLPISAGWQTIRQSYLSETRTRARCYHIPEVFLRDGGAL